MKILLAEDQIELGETVRALLAREPDCDFQGFATDAAAFMRFFENGAPDLVLLDIDLRGVQSGIDLLHWLGSHHPRVKPIMFTVETASIAQCYEMGARGYLLKDRLDLLPDTLRRVHEGQILIPPDIADRLVRQMRAKGEELRLERELQVLSDREMELLVHLKEGRSREAAADAIGISYFTVRRHVQNILAKMKSPSIRQLLDRYGKFFIRKERSG